MSRENINFRHSGTCLSAGKGGNLLIQDEILDNEIPDILLCSEIGKEEFWNDVLNKSLQWT